MDVDYSVAAYSGSFGVVVRKFPPQCVASQLHLNSRRELSLAQP